MVCMPICSSHGGAATSGRRRADGASEMLDMSEINVTALARVYDPAALHGRMHAQVPPPAKVRRRVLCVRHWCTSACVRACVRQCPCARGLIGCAHARSVMVRMARSRMVSPSSSAVPVHQKGAAHRAEQGSMG